jgi:hypothetical protein
VYCYDCKNKVPQAEGGRSLGERTERHFSRAVKMVKGSGDGL